MGLSIYLFLGMFLGILLSLAIVWIFLKNRNSDSNKELNAIKGQLNLIATSGSQSQQAVSEMVYIY